MNSRSTTTLMLVLVATAASSTAFAQSARFERECQKWISERGYSTDYVEMRLGKRQPGLGSDWRGNRDIQDATPGDVVLIRLAAPGAQHSAVVEEIRRDANGRVSAVRVSEWNWGKMVEARCLVTDNFKNLAPPRWAPVETIASVWHPE